MKIIPKKIFLAMVLVMTVTSVFADPPTPTPTLPPPPGLPVDGGLVLLLIAGVLLGSYTIYKKTRYKKTSV
ncbi:PID-CTERM protein-sorting domain-containing protein [Flavobacterium sp. PL002]|uniref:PID-CTERM protein-sorting domain-containing protein n=1 Tax=Flavobacterium sp. PL002 TaxID=1897058 RepID=UPI0019EC7922|nr:hypothetical protein [Flavobacterium sp. PL002]MBE0393646.1 hypothetical protein [Flavobacterium sp. PL002]